MRRIPLYAAVFLVGFSVMGFEMTASRLIVPWFGGGIDTWASLISTVLTGLTLGYFVGAALPPRWKTRERVAGVLLAAAFYMALVPLLSGSILRAVSDGAGEGALPLLLSTVLVCFVPITLLGVFAPCSVDLMDQLMPRHDPGEIAGQLYGISTLGSVCGTLGTTFVLIPSFGSSTIVLLLAALTFAAAALLWIHPPSGAVRSSKFVR